MTTGSFLFGELAPVPRAEEVSREIKTRPYQQDAIDAVFREWDTHAATLVVLPTGTGKSVVFAKVLDRWLRERPGRVMILAHRQELIVQAQAHAEAAGASCEIEMAGQFATKSAKVVAASVQTLNSSAKCYQCHYTERKTCPVCHGNGKLKRMTRFDPHAFGLIITDEGHHATATSYRDVYQWFRQNEHSRRLFVTATPERADGNGLHNVCDTVAYEMDLPTACREGWLCVPRQQFIEVDGLSLAKVTAKRGDLADGELQRAFLGEDDEEQERLLHAIARPVLEIAKGQQFIVFATGVDHARLLQAAFNAYRGTPLEARVETLLGSTDAFERADIVQRLKNGTTQGLVNVGVATEGFDCPAVAVVAIARPTKSKSLYMQMIGRGTRPLPGIVDGPATAEARLEAIAASAKPFCTVLDFVGNAGKHKIISVADCLAGNTTDVRDLETAIQIARQAKSAEDMTALLEKARASREEKEKREAQRREISTRRVATSVEITQVSVPLFDGKTFNAYTDYRPAHADAATIPQVAALVRLGVDPNRATKMTKRQAGEVMKKMSERTGGERILPFGKYSGTPIKDVPRGYLQWMEQTFSGQQGGIMEHVRAFLHPPATPQSRLSATHTTAAGDDAPF